MNLTLTERQRQSFFNKYDVLVESAKKNFEEFGMPPSVCLIFVQPTEDKVGMAIIDASKLLDLPGDYPALVGNFIRDAFEELRKKGHNPFLVMWFWEGTAMPVLVTKEEKQVLTDEQIAAFKDDKTRALPKRESLILQLQTYHETVYQFFTFEKMEDIVCWQDAFTYPGHAYGGSVDFIGNQPKK